jgi:hypothetical protein
MADRAERLAEKDLKRRQAQNEAALLGKFDTSQTPPTLAELDVLAAAQAISLEGYHYLRQQKFQSDEGHDNNKLIFQIQSQIANGVDQTKEIYEGTVNGQISGPTSRSLMGTNNRLKDKDWGNSNESFYFKYITRMMNAEGFGVKLTDEDAARVGRAQREYFERVKGKEDPKTVADDIVQRYRTYTPGPDQIPVPRFGHTPKDAADATAQAVELFHKYEEGDIDQVTYQREVQILEQWKNLLTIIPPAAPSQTGGNKAKVKP